MIKKLSLLAMAVGALVAFAAPATAGAEGILMDKDGTLQPGAEITATSENIRMTTQNGTLSCEKVTFHGTVDTNNTEHGRILPHPESPELTVSNPCEVEEPGLEMIITDPTFEEITIDANGTGVVTGATFVGDIPAAGLECHFEGNLGLTYETNTDVITLPQGVGPNLVGSGENCPPAMEMHGDFTLETEDGTPVFVT